MNTLARPALLLFLAIHLATVTGQGAEDSAVVPGIDQRLLDGLNQPNPLRLKSEVDVPGEDLGATQPKSTLASLAQLMKSVEQRLRNSDTSMTTQQAQRDIAGELAKMLDAAEQNQENQASSAESSETETQETAGEESGEQGDPKSKNRDATDETSAAVDAVWGTLPAQLRQQIQSPLQEDFLPRYERVIKEYYRRVAEQQRKLRD